MQTATAMALCGYKLITQPEAVAFIVELEIGNIKMYEGYILPAAFGRRQDHLGLMIEK